MGSGLELPNGRMYSAWPRKPSEVFDVCRKNHVPSSVGLM